jgi:aspartyl-tRNA synthetase
MTYAEAMTRFGSDKPDLRLGLELVDLTSYFADTPFRVFQAPHVGAVVMPGGASQPRKTFDAWQEWAKQRGARGLAYVTFGADGELGGPVAKNLSEQERAGLREAVGASPATARSSEPVSGRAPWSCSGGTTRGGPSLRLDRRVGVVVRVGRRRADVRAHGRRGWTAVHHPFTSPNTEWADTFAATRSTRWPMRTTSSATATSSAADRSVSTAATCSSRSSTSSV